MVTIKPPHLALLPCAGMGHLIPFLRLAAMLMSRGCNITLITAHPTVTSAESDQLSNFLTAHLNIRHHQLQLLPYNKSKLINEDPFFIQVESIGNSVHLLRPFISSLSPPLSAFIADFPVASSIIQLASDLSISVYVVTSTSARFFSLMSYLPHLKQDISSENDINIPGLGQIPFSSVPPPLINCNNYFSANMMSNVLQLSKAKGILMNTFNSFEPEAISALRNGEVSPHVSCILPIGPLEPYETEQADEFPWLDEQKPESVIFVSFGNRTALSKDQIRELASALEKSECKFLWVLKTSKVDKEDKEQVEEILGSTFLERTENQGMVFKGWVNQDMILAHPAVGGFVSHCGWNSVMEAARLGVPILAWPLHGDQRVNAEVVERAGLGLWVRDWGWMGEKLVEENEIAEKIVELMMGGKFRDMVKQVKEKAGKARETSGDSERVLQEFIQELKNKEH